MNKISYSEFKHRMEKFNELNDIKRKGNDKCFVKGVVVITEDSFDKKYTLEQRSFLTTSDNKGFINNPDLIGKSIFASALSGDDDGVRLDWYLEEEGNKDGWKVDYCYFLDENV